MTDNDRNMCEENLKKAATELEAAKFFLDTGDDASVRERIADGLSYLKDARRNAK